MSHTFVSSNETRRTATIALLVAGLGWGTTGLYVRTLGHLGFSVYELLVVRLVVAGLLILPGLGWDLARTRRKLSKSATLMLGFSMTFYYLGAIAAFSHLPLVNAALVIGSSPLLAWLLPLILERRAPRKEDVSQGLGVALGVLGLFVLLLGHDQSRPVEKAGTSHAIGYLGGFVAAFITVLNARFLNRLGSLAPKPFEITIATVLLGLCFGPFLISNPAQVLEFSAMHPWMILGFGLLSTAIPGLAIVFASIHLKPQATATVSIQIQVWAGVLGWIILGEAMNLTQIVAGLMVIGGSWIVLKPRPMSV